jgi:hypothetical protein
MGPPTRTAPGTTSDAACLVPSLPRSSLSSRAARTSRPGARVDRLGRVRPRGVAQLRARRSGRTHSTGGAEEEPPRCRRGTLLPAFPPAERARYGQPLGDRPLVPRGLLSAPPPPRGSTAAGILACPGSRGTRSPVRRPASPDACLAAAYVFQSSPMLPSPVPSPARDLSGPNSLARLNG